MLPAVLSVHVFISDPIILLFRQLELAILAVCSGMKFKASGRQKESVPAHRLPSRTESLKLTDWCACQDISPALQS